MSNDDLDEYDMEMDDDEYGNQIDGMKQGMHGGDQFLAKKRKKKKKKVKRRRPNDFEDPSLREHLLAGAYGGVAKQKVKREGVKYTTDIDSGLRDLATPGIIRNDHSRRNINANFGMGAGSNSVENGGESARRPRHRVPGHMSETSSRLGGS